MAIANIHIQNHLGLAAHELQTGQIYLAKTAGYGIIVIEDTMAPVVGRPLGTFNDADLVILTDAATRRNVAPSHLDPLGPTTRHRPELLLRPVILPDGGIQILVHLPG